MGNGSSQDFDAAAWQLVDEIFRVATVPDLVRATGIQESAVYSYRRHGHLPTIPTLMRLAAAAGLKVTLERE